MSTFYCGDARQSEYIKQFYAKERRFSQQAAVDADTRGIRAKFANMTQREKLSRGFVQDPLGPSLWIDGPPFARVHQESRKLATTDHPHRSQEPRPIEFSLCESCRAQGLPLHHGHVHYYRGHPFCCYGHPLCCQSYPSKSQRSSRP